jgi:hypothetical protein
LLFVGFVSLSQIRLCKLHQHLTHSKPSTASPTSISISTSPRSVLLLPFSLNFSKKHAAEAAQVRRTTETVTEATEDRAAQGKAKQAAKEP